MIYVLKGWIKTELEGQGAHVMRPGSAWLQPPKIKHKVLDYSDDCEVLEIILPAEFETTELELSDARSDAENQIRLRHAHARCRTARHADREGGARQASL